MILMTGITNVKRDFKRKMMWTMNRRSTANIRRNGDSTEEMLRVSWYYYKMGMTQTEIAKRLNTNRVRVMKLLEGALEQGIVEIRIKDPRANLLQIETDLVQAFGLQDAIVIPTDSADVSLADLNEQLGMAAAQFLSTVFQDGDILAIGWGDSVSKTIKHLHLDHIKDFHLISLSGGMLPLLSDWSFFGKYLQHLKILPAPLVVSDTATSEALISEPEVKEIFRMWELSTYALVGIGTISADATMRKKGYISEVQQAALRRMGAVGDILGQFYDAAGNHIPFETDARLVAQSIHKIKGMSNVIGVAGGMDKLEAIKAALKGGYVKILVTDEEVACSLVESQR
jgi:lsr operon transcriptional repressor